MIRRQMSWMVEMEEGMHQDPFEQIEQHTFLSLAEQMGLGLREEELEAMLHHKLLVAPRGRLTRLHLYVLARYDEQVRLPHHPWRAKPQAELVTTKTLALQVAELVEALGGARAVSVAELESLAVEMERYLVGLDPFGPLSGIIDLLREDVRAQLRGVGRRYVELRRVASQLAELAERLERRRDDEPMTRPVDLDAPDSDDAPSSIKERPVTAPVKIEEPAPAPEPQSVAPPSPAQEDSDPHEATAILDGPISDLALESIAEDEDVELSEISTPRVGLAAGSTVADADPARSVPPPLPPSVSQALPSIPAAMTEATRLEDIPLADDVPSADEAKPQAGSLSQMSEASAASLEMGAAPALSFGAEALSETVAEEIPRPISTPASGKPALGIKRPEGRGALTAELQSLPKRELTVRRPQPTPAPLGAVSVSRPGAAFSRASNEVTVQNDALRERLEALRANSAPKADEASSEDIRELADRAESLVRHTREPHAESQMMSEARLEDAPDDEFSEAREAKPTMVRIPALHGEGLQERPPTPEELEERVNQLNRLREQHLKSQDWAALAALYEDGLGLFEPVERVQIFETLAKLYAVKLKDPERAWSSIERGWLGAQREEDRLRIMPQLEKLGSKRGAQWVRWLEEEIGRLEVRGPLRFTLQRALAFALHQEGQDARAFLMFAAYVADHAEDALTDDALADLERLAGESQREELFAFLDDMIESGHHAARVALYAARLALKSGAQVDASRYWTAALVHQVPAHELLDEIEESYLGRGGRSAFVRLLDAAIDRTPAHVAKLEHALEQALEAELAHPEAAQEEYSARLERDPDDMRSCQRLLRFYNLHQRQQEGYELLKAHVDKIRSTQHKATLLEELGQIAQRYLMEPSAASEHYEQALALGGPSRSLFESLARVYLEQAKWDKAAAAIEGLFEHRSTWAWTSEDTAYWGMLGALAAQRLAQADRRRMYLERVLTEIPTHREAREALNEMGG